jgi:hypothetical protein
MFANRLNGKTLVLFDVDGTLTPARQVLHEILLTPIGGLRRHVEIVSCLETKGGDWVCGWIRSCQTKRTIRREL